MTLAPDQFRPGPNSEAGASGRATRDLRETAASAAGLPDEPWESEMSQAVAHLVSAFAAVERLRKLTPDHKLATVPFDLATQSICTALVALDECGISLLFGAGASDHTPASNWRESLLAIYYELGLMT